MAAGSFQKYNNHRKILGARNEIRSKVHTAGAKMLRDTVHCTFVLPGAPVCTHLCHIFEVSNSPDNFYIYELKHKI
jgi:hypothetical protein